MAQIAHRPQAGATAGSRPPRSLDVFRDPAPGAVGARIDWTPYLIAMLAIDRRHIGRGFSALNLIGVVVNPFGAATFGRANPFYYA